MDKKTQRRLRENQKKFPETKKKVLQAELNRDKQVDNCLAKFRYWETRNSFAPKAFEERLEQMYSARFSQYRTEIRYQQTLHEILGELKPILRAEEYFSFEDEILRKIEESLDRTEALTIRLNEKLNSDIKYKSRRL